MAKEPIHKRDAHYEAVLLIRGFQNLIVEADDHCTLTPEELYVFLQVMLERVEMANPAPDKA